MKKSQLRLLALLAAFALIAGACSSDATDETTADTEAGTTSDTEASTTGSDEQITIEFWHAMADDLGAVVDELVGRYNDSQDAVVVNATFQGSYDDTYNALLASFDAGSEPNIVQNFDLAAQTMFDTGRLVPAHELMAEGQAESYLGCAT